MPKGKSKKQEAPAAARPGPLGDPSPPGLQAVSPPPASQPAEVPPPPELDVIWNQDVADLFAAMRPQQQNFLIAYLQLGNASAAYRHAYNASASPHLASVGGSQLLASVGISRILSKLTDRKTEAMLTVSRTYFEMTEAKNPAFVQIPGTKEWKDVGVVPDWRTRGTGAVGLERIYGLQPDVKPFTPLGGEGGIPAPFAVQFNVYAQQMGLPIIALPAPIVEAESTPAPPPKKARKAQGPITDFGKDFQEFAGG